MPYYIDQPRTSYFSTGLVITESESLDQLRLTSGDLSLKSLKKDYNDTN